MTEIRQTKGQAGRLHEVLRREYLNACHALNAEQVRNGRLVRDAGAALATVLPPPDIRRKLWNKRLAALGASSGAAPPPSDRPPNSPYLQLLARQPHPGLLLVDRKQALSGVAETASPAGSDDPAITLHLARAGETVRKSLSSLERSVATEAQRTDRLSEAGGESTASTLRSGLSAADRLTRAIAAVEPESSPQEHAVRLHNLDLRSRLLWRTHHILEDFWADFFSPAGEAQLQLVLNSGLAPGQSSYAGQSLTTLLAARTAAADKFRDSLRLQTPELGLDQDPSQTVVIKAWGEPPQNLPSGAAALFLSDLRAGDPGEVTLPAPDAKQQIVRRRAIPWTTNTLNQPVRLEFAPQLRLLGAGEPATSGWPLTAALTFRGHLAIADDLITKRAIERWEFRRSGDQLAQVQVDGEGVSPADIMIIVDCSNTMTRGGRMAAARRAIKNVIDALWTINSDQANQPFSVGLTAYGHRLHVDAIRRTVLPNRPYVSEAEFQRLTDEKVGPDTDVERLHPIQRLDQTVKTKLFDELDELAGWGYTPLYLAMAEALRRDFPVTRRHVKQRLIVVTDGRNNTSNGFFKKLAENTIDSPNKVIDAKNAVNPNVQAFIIGFKNIEEDDRKTLIDLAQKLGGKYLVANQADLGKQILELLTADVKQFAVTPRTPRDPMGRDLGKIWPVAEPQRATAGRHDVVVSVRKSGRQLASQPVRLEGGEHLQLQYLDREGRLEFVRYQPPTAAGREQTNVVAEGAREPYRMGALKPRWGRDGAGDQLEFFVYLQRMDLERFTERPRFAWAEIQPLDVERRPVGEPLVRYDFDFLSGQPAPVLRFVADKSDWPATARRASLQVWMRFDDPTRSKPLNIDAGSQQQSLPQTPGAMWEITRTASGGRQIVVRGIGGAAEQAAVLLAPPSAAVRREFSRGNQVRHSFLGAPSGPCQLWVIPREDLIAGALHPLPFLVNVERRR